MAPSRKPSYRSDLFDTSAFASIDAVDYAVEELQTIVNETNAGRILEEIFVHEQPAIVRLVLSTLNEELITSCFPAAAEGFGDSLAYKILAQLSEFFLFAQRVPALHENHHGLVKEAPALLAAIASRMVVNEFAAESTPLGLKKGKTTTQKKVKMARRVKSQGESALDPNPFEHLNIPVPESTEEFEQCAGVVLTTQRSILEAYLESLRLPAVAASIKAACLPTESDTIPESDDALESESAEAAGLAVGIDASDPSDVSYVPMQPVKFSTLYRRRANGFGEWEINIAPRAERDLREYNRRDRKMFLIIVHKMRELSNGYFSHHNYKQIDGDNVEFPIYEAWVTEELRLVYQVDCVQIYDTNEHQALKVFGIYRYEQIARGTFWNSLSRQLEKKGPEYKDKCALRQKSLATTDGYTFVPITFPTPNQAMFSTGGVPNLPSDDAEQIQSILLKTVHFSQELLESILADRDVAFVLQISPQELNVIEHPNSCYVLGRSGTGKSTTIIYKMLMVEASCAVLPPGARKIRQVFVTRSPTLADKVGEHFAKLLGGYRPSTISENVKAAKKADRALVYYTEADDDWRSDLPKKYSDLQDTDFPLFVSFERLCSMIECDMLASDSDGAPAGKPTLTYNVFRREYWPHLPQVLCKGYDPAMVFSEVMGVIKGSEESLTSNSRYLTREVYSNIGERRQSTFAEQRGQIYDIFEKAIQSTETMPDIGYSTHLILNFFRTRGVPGRRIDYFSFRFQELKAFLFRLDQNRRQKNHAGVEFRSSVPPRVFQLTVNYRSHTGIVNCAHSIIEIITKLWPNAIDVLDPERGIVDGLRPIFFTNWDSENVQSKQFLFGDQPSGGNIELGAQQCILVRDDAARQKLRKLVGDIGIIMTLYESKGLEFNDVLLYNFFNDSGASEGQWRVVYSLIKDGPPAPSLDNTRHAQVCTELKFLYVAITRARNNIWIADCSTKGEPMRMLWTSRDQVQNCILGKDTPRFAISSTPTEWREQGMIFFEKGQFQQAKLCYERALMPHEATVAHAYHLRQKASEMPDNLRRERKPMFSDAAAAFMKCAKNLDEDSTKTAEVYNRIAGDCFVHAGDKGQAITAYTLAKYYNPVVKLYRSMGKFEEAVATIKNHSGDIDPEIAESVIGVARLFYFRERQLEKAEKLFNKPEEALKYLEDRGMDGERATILESLGRFSDAAELHANDGRTDEAIALFLRDQNNERASDCTIQRLWEKLSFAVRPDGGDARVATLIGFATQVESSKLPPQKRDEISMFQAVANRDKHKLPLLAQSLIRFNDPAAALLCLDHYFDGPPRIQDLPTQAVAENLGVFFDYVKLLYHVAFNLDPCNSSAAAKLFGFRKDGDLYSIPAGTFIRLALSDCPTDETILLTGLKLRTTLQQSLKNRLVRKVLEENDMCQKNKAFAGLCPTFALFNGRCNRDSCPQEHLLASSFDSREYNLRVRIHLQQILIYHGLRSVNTEQRSINADQRRFWLSRLYAVLNPLSYQLGSAASLDWNLIPEAKSGLQVVKEWVWGCVYTHEFAPQFHFLTRLVQLAYLGFQFDGTHAMSYLNRSPFMTAPTKPAMYGRPPDGRYVVAEFLSALEDQNEWCLSAEVMFLRHIVMFPVGLQVNVLCDVAEDICAGLAIADQHLLFEGKNLAIVRSMVKNIFLFRICRCLCLLAYNFRSYELRDFVWQSITSLRMDPSRQFMDPSRQFTSVISRYVHARTWSGLVAALRVSAGGSTHDEMVRILHASRNRPIAVDGVRQIVYERMEDIPRLLRSSTTSTASAANVVSAPQVADAPDEEGTDADEQLPKDGPIDMPTIPEPEAPTEEELDSATKIWTVYLRTLHRGGRRRRETGGSILKSELQDLFTQCRGQSLTMDRSHRWYRYHFLGPLPHLLLCLDVVHTGAQKEAKRITSESAEHEALEILDKKLKDVQRTLTKIDDVRRALEPASELHARQNLCELKRWAKQAVEALQTLPFGTPPGVREHLDIAYKVNLAFALSSLRPPDATARLRVGILDLDIFGPSIPTLMGLQKSEEPLLTSGGALIPLINHGIPTMSMGYLLPRSADTNSTNDSPVVWRGLMVQKAVQQLLFDVDWRDAQGHGLDVLVVDMPPGTGDVPLTLGQLVIVDGAVIVSTPQDVALADVSKGIAMLRKVAVPVAGIVLNQSHFMCPGCETRHYLYGPPEPFRATAGRLGVEVLAELPLVPGVSQGGDSGLPYGLASATRSGDNDGQQ
ncbi:hypothetical protein C8R47DRAFT_1212438 [Mycena vitilis]|nr:hypothetical protein C8R47DRAFT_1212438 [Mycena vitilis]